MKYFELCEKSRLLAKEIMEDDLFKELVECKKTIDRIYQKEIEAFKTSEIKFDEVKKYGTYHPDYQKYKKAFMDAKNQLFGLDLVKRYKELERMFQKKLETISDTIKQSIKRN